MKKFTSLTGIEKTPCFKRLFRIMKLTSFLLFISVVSVMAGETYSQTKMLTLDSPNNDMLADFQQKSVSGTVTDENGQPLPGVTVAVKGNTMGTITDANGNYSLTNIPEDATLVFSFVGMLTQEVIVGSQTNINISLAVDAIGIEEVVVIGYGSERRVNVIGSIAQVTSEEIENRPVTTISNALAGQMTGVTVIQRSGKPGFSDGEISIRGIGSFGATPSALILVDGIPTSMNEININDIEYISVLKDASSAAIYGARAANGVILITTKKGKEGVTVSYNGYYGVSTPTAFPEFVNSWEYAEMYNIAVGTKAYSDEDIEKYRSQSDLDNYPNTDFLGHVLSRNGIKNSHDISISGGRNSSRYFLSAGILDEQGLVVRNNYKRYNFRLNLENDLSNSLTLITRVAGSVEEANEPIGPDEGDEDVESLISNAVRTPAIYLGQASNGDYGTGYKNIGTPFSFLAAQGYGYRPTTKASINSQLKWEPINDLVLSAIAGYHFTVSEGRIYQPSQHTSTINIETSRLEQYKNNSDFKTMQFIAEYKKEFIGHDINVLGGYSFENESNKFFSGQRVDFVSNDYTVMNMGSLNGQQVEGNDTEWAIQSFFGRLKYNYNHKYLFELSVRYDGSSRFPPTHKYGAFPSLAAGWRITEEDFFKKAVPWVSNLKLKASWGKLGNQNIGNYPWQATLASGRDYPFGTGVSTGAAYTTYKDPELHWESTEVKDIGLESGFLDGKIMLNATYFDRFTSDILYKPSSSVSNVLGLAISETNTGEVKNSGWEFELGHQNSFTNFSYQLNGNFTIIENEVVTLGLGNVEQPNGMVGNGTDLFIGYPMEMYYGYKSDGVFISEEDIGEWADQSAVTPRPQPGDLRYMDISGPEGEPDGIVDATYDRTYIGSRIPKYNFGFNFSAQYKQFDFSVLLQGVSGVEGFLDYYIGRAFENLGSIQKWQMEGRFNPENPVRYPDYPRLEIITPSGTPNTEPSDFWILDGSYLRIKNLQAGYTLPKKILNAIRMDALRIYFSAENVHTFSYFRPGWDPEINARSSYYPILAAFTLGVNVKF